MKMHGTAVEKKSDDEFQGLLKIVPQNVRYQKH